MPGDASNNDTTATWVLLDARTDETWKAGGEYHYYSVENNTAYKTYKITFPENAGDGSYVQWNYMEYVCDATCRLTIESVPVSIATVTPALGVMKMPNEATTFTSEASATTENVKAVCTGYKVYTASETEGWVEDVSRSGTTTSFTWETMPTVDTKVEWQYSAECRLILEDAASGGGSAMSEREWIAFGNDATITAVPSDGYSFFCWSGDVPAGCEEQNPLTLTMDMPKTIQPVFKSNDAIGPILFVSTTGNDNNDGLTPSAALLTVSAAITKLKESTGGIIHVGAGTFEQSASYVLNHPIQMIGAGKDEGGTVLRMKSGVNQRVFTISDPGVSVSNLAIENGRGICWDPNGGGGVYITDGVVSNCVVRNCHSEQFSSYQAFGGGIRIAGAGALVSHCIITNCTVRSTADWHSQHGAGVFINSGGTLRDSLVADCRSSVNSTHEKVTGGVRIENGKAVNCTVIDCWGTSAGGISVSGENASVTNCVAFGCEKRLNSSSGEVNTTVSGFGGTESCYVNCASEASGLTEGAFVDYLHGDYTPMIGGALYDKGLALSDAPATDLNGNARVQDAGMDVGCLEGAKVISFLVAGYPDNYGETSLGWGTRTDLTGEITATTDQTWVREDGLFKAECSGWTLSTWNGSTWEIKTQGDAATATFEVPNVLAKLEWQYKHYHHIKISVVGDGAVEAPEWIEESTQFTPTPSANEGWHLLGWIDRDNAVIESANVDQLQQSIDWTALYLPQGIASPVQYVKTAENGGDDANDGFTEDKAKASIASAVAAIASYGNFGGTIHVAPGEYAFPSESISITTPIQIYGETTTGLPGEIVFNGADSSARAFTLNHPGALVSSFVITNSHNTAGPQVFIDAKGGILTNCVVRNSYGNTAHNAKGPVYATGANSLVTHTIVSDAVLASGEGAWTAQRGCGITVESGARAENCLVTNCTTAIKVDSIEDASDGTKKPKSVGGIYVGSKSVAVNCTVVDCQGYLSGGIYAAGGFVTNCVAIACGYVGGTAVNGANSRYDLAGTTDNFVNCAGDMETTVNDIEENRCLAGLTLTAFRDAANGDFRPKADGPLANGGAAIPEWANMLDLAGNPRVMGRIDIGAFEAPPSGTIILIL